MNKLENIILDDNGKDDRLKILNNGMTKYGCRPIPYEHISYSSCTASTISLESFTHVNDYYNRLNINNKNEYIQEFQSIRDDIRNILGLKDDVDICLAPSGTDLEMIPYMFIPQSSKVKNIVIGPNEVGSGTSLAVQGCVFSNVDASKYSIKKGDKLEEFESYEIDVINIPIRNDMGNPVEEKEILQKITSFIENKDSYKILHSVYHSKTGLINPSPESLVEISKNDEKSIIVVDACQFRISRESINKFLDIGCIIFITGSKFFAGPTFSAAALIPSQIRDIAAYKEDIPKGLNFLFGRELFPLRWKSVNNFEYGNNLGLLLRWRAAIFEMRLFNSVSKERIINTIKIFNEIIQKVIKKEDKFIIYSDICSDNENDYDRLMSNTILTFGFNNKNIDIDQAKEIYQNLINKEWLNEEYPYVIHLGQPVKIKKYNGRWVGTLRIALSAKFFVNYSGKVSNIQKDLIFEELSYIFRAIKKFI